MVDVVLVDEQGNKTGLMERMLAHKNPGVLHKAVSVLLYRRTTREVEVLLQKRSKQKPLWPEYWANTVCTHPLDGESVLDCAVRRLTEEMGIVMKQDQLTELYSFAYQADYNQELSEHEYDWVIVGEYEGEYELNPDEVIEAKWIGIEELRRDMQVHPSSYAPWPSLIVKASELTKYLSTQEVL